MKATSEEEGAAGDVVKALTEAMVNRNSREGIEAKEETADLKSFLEKEELIPLLMREKQRTSKLKKLS